MTSSSNNVSLAGGISPEDLDNHISDARLNRTFQLPADPSRGRPRPLQISYADFGFVREDGSDEGGEERVLLFFGALMSSRLFHAAKDGMAKRYKARIVTAERPGIGKTDSVPAEMRLQVWRDATVALLNHLAIKHVSIGCHSGGTVFALDFAVHNPQFLHPSRPYIAIGSPWIHPSHSRMRAWRMASALPSSLVAQTGNLAAFAESTLGPVFGASAVVSDSVQQLWTQARPTADEPTDVQFENGVRERMRDRVFAEGIRGLGLECQVLLRNGAETDGWSDWGDYDELAPRLVEAVRANGGGRLKMDVFFAEKDHMVGDAGTEGCRWLEACWKDVDGMDFASETVKGSDHDNLWDLRWDVFERVLRTMTTDA